MEKQVDEEKILEFWEKQEIYKKSQEKNKNGKPFYLMDGPPYATGHIHMGTALNKISKDIALRSQRLQGKNVFDRAGYDTHGVPIEFKIEKEIGSKSKQDIEKYGIKKFIEKCKEFATKHIDVMGSEFKNLGVWMDFESPYLTLDTSYIETIWDTFKEADKKNLLYLGKYPVHICPRCETAVSFNEIEYTKQKDTSVFVKFKLKEKENTYLIIWTTTPWTLPANTGIMVNPKVEYQLLKLSSGETWIIAREKAAEIMAQLEMGFTIQEEILGSEMVGWTYESPLSKHLNLKTKDAYRVVASARYVTTEEGTGLVHCAPGHGKEDYEVGKEAGLDSPCPVGINGLLTEETGKYKNKKARVVDAEIIEDLEKEGFLIYKMPYTHDYPLCWRCKSPLLMISQPQWFLKISKIQEQILKENEKTNWIPKWMQLRMKAWLQGISDWPISRKRYWGTPLPIWKCDACEEKIVIGSLQELEKLSKKQVAEVHKPEIDTITIPCACGKEMSRIEEVLDVWFDSGVSSWAALNYMEKDPKFEEFWPATINIEGKDQVRGWWNSQFILSHIKFGKKAFENIMVHGMVLDLGKKKMSKSVGNIIAPEDIIKEHSRDFLRYYFAKTSKGEDFSLQEREFKEINKTFMMIHNVHRFVAQLEYKKGKEQVEDKWITSRFNNTVQEVVKAYNNFDFPEAIKLIENFLIKDFSRTYIQIIRDRAQETKKQTREIMMGLLKLIAPVTPFISEALYQKLKEENDSLEESIHLELFPSVTKKKIDEKLENQFKILTEILEKSLNQRNESQIGLKWPLPKLKIITSSQEEIKQFEDIIKTQVNVKKISYEKGETLQVNLDTNMTPELEAEGFTREIMRKIQAARKQANLIKEDRINLEIVSEFNDKLESQKSLLQEKVGVEKLSFEESSQKFNHSEEGKIKGKSFLIRFKKL